MQFCTFVLCELIICCCASVILWMKIDCKACFLIVRRVALLCSRKIHEGCLFRAWWFSSFLRCWPLVQCAVIANSFVFFWWHAQLPVSECSLRFLCSFCRVGVNLSCRSYVVREAGYCKSMRARHRVSNVLFQVKKDRNKKLLWFTCAVGVLAAIPYVIDIVSSQFKQPAAKTTSTAPAS